MREVDYREYLEFVSSKRNYVTVEGQVIRLHPIIVERFDPRPSELTDVSTTVWSFPERGSWATHKGDYRGNWPPQLVRAFMLMYTKPNDVVLDPMVGSGTTCVEARLLGRNCIGVDISYDAVILTLHRLYWLEESAKRFTGLFPSPSVENVLKTWSKVYHGDARRLDKLEDSSIDAVAVHPPYWGIIEYSSGEPGDLSAARTLEEYLRMMEECAREMYRVLKPGGYLCILIGDTRIHKHYVPITHHVLKLLLKVGFILKEEVIKVQHKMKTTREVWSRLEQKDFLLIYHEKLFIMRKPSNEIERKKLRYSTHLDL